MYKSIKDESKFWLSVEAKHESGEVKLSRGVNRNQVNLQGIADGTRMTGTFVKKFGERTWKADKNWFCVFVFQIGGKSVEVDVRISQSLLQLAKSAGGKLSGRPIDFVKTSLTQTRDDDGTPLSTPRVSHYVALSTVDLTPKAKSETPEQVPAEVEEEDF